MSIYTHTYILIKFTPILDRNLSPSKVDTFLYIGSSLSIYNSFLHSCAIGPKNTSWHVVRFIQTYNYLQMA